MTRNGNESSFATAFATLVCAWVVALVVLGLGSASQPGAGPVTAAAVTAAAQR